MGGTDVLTRKSGVIVGDDVLALFKYAREKGFAIPAVVSFSRFYFFAPPPPAVAVPSVYPPIPTANNHLSPT